MPQGLRRAAGSARYIGVNLSKNALVPVVLPLMPNYGSSGLDGNLPAVLHALETVTAPGLAALGGGLKDRHVVELGPGRTPEMMAAMLLAGARRADGFDTVEGFPHRWQSPDRYAALASALAGGSCPAFLDAARTGTEQIAARFEELSAHPLPMDVHRYDGIHIDLMAGSVDLVFSKSVLEHVEAAAVQPLMAELRRVITRSGGMTHFIDLRDHTWIDGDDRVTGDWLQALRYPDWLFKAMFSRRGMYINRLRASSWRQLFEKQGFTIRRWSETDFPLSRDFSHRQLRGEWQQLSQEELAVGLVEVSLSGT